MTARRTQGKRVCRWIERYCCFTDAEWIGKPFRFQSWQRRLVYELFEVGLDDLRRYRWALVGLPKKNGKTTLAAALALYLLIGDGEPSPLVACAAASEEQADLVFGAAKRMCELSPELAAITERFDKEILVPSIPGAKLIRVAAAVGTNDGKNLHGVICDELHEWAPPKGDNVWNVLTNGIGARRQPLILQITTAGYDVDGTVCGQQYAHGRRIQSGEVDDPTYYFRWHEAPADADYRDPAVWEAANPSYGVTVHEPFFRDQLTKKTEAVFRRYFLNQWTTSEEIWIPETTWEACRAPELDLDVALPLFVGIDMAHSNDSAAVVCVQRQEQGRTVVRSRVWDNPYPRTHALHEHWRINPLEVEQHLRDLYAKYPVPAADIDGMSKAGPAFYYDPAWFSRSAPVLEGDGLAMIEFPQCVAPDTPVTLADGSRLPASMIEEGDVVLGRDNRFGVVTAAVPIPPKPCVRVETKAGRRLVVTSDHPFLVRRRSATGYGEEQWITAAALRRGDRLMVALGYLAPRRSALPDDECWALGLFVGDGNLHAGRIAFTVPAIAEKLSRLFSLTVRDGYADVHGSRRWLRAHGFRSEVAWQKYVPSHVMGDGWESQAAFLAGLLDSDGTVRSPKLRGQIGVRWISTSYQLLTDCQHMLAGLSIPASVAPSHAETVRWRPAWTLSVGGREPVARLYALLGPHLAHGEKQARLAATADLPAGEWQEKLQRRRQTDPVVLVESVGERETVGLSVSHGTHVTAGLVTHNTDARMVPASQTLYQMATEGLLAHDGDPALKRHVLNAVADHRPRGWRLSKPKGSRRKIDACIALAIGNYHAQERTSVGSVYESRSLLILGE